MTRARRGDVARMTKRHDDQALLQAFGRAVRARRESLGLTREQFGAAIGTDAKNLYRLESGTENVSLLRVERVAQALGLCVHDLVCGDLGHASADNLSKQPEGQP